ncbi:MAG: T9SS type A sorting domain-containing protein [Candidatus Eisenbacteria bacterium]|uniref:T9SS type A sorting domain-containing protein n=1 Tax=Eiseniibacteriota bacterium TaxID=2212470 RepID=A0A538S808_UNCEI|nr:MAG: T9SS type A sorting domain-containing protein [Candidatus Eisenbacteria bacterium]
MRPGSPLARSRRGAAAALILAGLCAGTLPRPGGATVPSSFVDELIVGSLNQPVSMAFLPDGRLLFVEQRSHLIRLIVNGAIAATNPVGTVTNVSTADLERGLLGIAVDPGWPARPYVYVYYSSSITQTNRISRFTLTGDLTFSGNGSLAADASSRYDVLTDIPDLQSNHNGGTLRFGPDAKLYASLGEDNSFCGAQDTVSLRGVILRLDPSGLPAGPGGPANKALIAPADNPFASHPNANARLTYALGLRNPFRFHIDPATGDLFIADVGWDSFEEVDRLVGGGQNMGWPMYEGNAVMTSCPGAGTSGLTFPIYTFPQTNPGDQVAIIGAGVYRPAASGINFPAEYNGDYFFGEYFAGFLRRLKRTGSTWDIAPAVPGQPSSTNWATGLTQVSDYLVGPDGALWYCKQAVNNGTNTGQIRRIAYMPPAQAGDPPAGQVGFAAPYPSPTSRSVTLSYSLPRAAHTELAVYDLDGRRVRELSVAAERPAGLHQVVWDGVGRGGARREPGIYFARLSVDGQVYQQRIAILR